MTTDQIPAPEGTENPPEFPALPGADEALRRAQALLDEDDDGYVADPETLLPNPQQGLWIVSYLDPRSTNSLDGGGIVVPGGDENAYYLSSAPGQPEYVGVAWPDDDEDDPDEGEIEGVLALFGAEAFAAAQFAGQDFDDTVCVMAIPAEDDPVHGIGPEDKHATLLYFGNKADHEDPERMKSAKGLLLEALTVAAGEVAPFSAQVTGVEPLGDEGARVWMLDSPELQRLFEEIPEVDSEVQSLYDGASGTKYPEYLPHVTVGYTGDDSAGSATGESVTDEDMAAAQAVESILFDRLSLWWGNEHVDIPLGANEFDAMLEYFEWDPTAHPRAEKGSPDGGRFKPGEKKEGDGEGGPARPTKSPPKKPTPSKDKGPADEPDPMTKSEKVAALVEGVMKALDKVMASLTSDQARALVERIKDNAEAFISGQEAAPHKGGGSKGGGGAKGSTPDKGGKSTPDKGGKDSGGSKDGGKDSSDSGPGGVAGIVAGVQSLLKQFGNQMKPADKKALTDAVGALDKA